MANESTATISAKRQITLPAAMVRELGLKPGGKLIIRLEGDRLVIVPQPESYRRALGGSLRGVYGEDVDAYIKEERAAWRH